VRVEDKILAGWGKTGRSQATVALPASMEDLLACVTSAAGDRGLIARHGGFVVDMTRWDEVESFVPGTGHIVCQAGVTIGRLVKDYLPQGFVPPTCPGTGFVTIGGAVAQDVHGKNHHREGSFGDHVQWFDLLLPSGQVNRVSRQSDEPLFRATIGGCGLTGVILRVAFGMARVPGNAVTVRERRMTGLDQMMDELEHGSARSQHVVAWVDALARGRGLGRGIYIAGDAADSSRPVRRRRSIRVPFDAPPGLLNRTTMGAFNALYFSRVRTTRVQEVEFGRFVFPLDALLEWNRLYGKRGVFQFQCVIPPAAARAGIRAILTRVAEAGAASPLAVLKTFGGHGCGYLSFPQPGFTLALDFPCTPHTRQLIGELYAVTVAHGGRTYLAKDICLDARLLRPMYPDVDQFLGVLRRLDPRGLMRSDMARRLGLVANVGGLHA
jgi:decaprenylphospho-beta-D-ribofuranose 2-oxidase